MAGGRCHWSGAHGCAGLRKSELSRAVFTRPATVSLYSWACSLTSLTRFSVVADRSAILVAEGAAGSYDGIWAASSSSSSAYGTVRRAVTWTLGDITGSTSMSGLGGE